jgi:UPF0176 protein
MPVIVSAFYKFVHVENPAALRTGLLDVCEAGGMRGTVLVAEEGLNGTISGEPGAMATTLAWLRADPRFADLETKNATAPDHPFKRMKIKVKREIITFREDAIDPVGGTGTYVQPADWNTLISDPDVLVIDTRNGFEVAAGTFKGAVDPKTRSFGEFPEYVQSELDPKRNRKIAMFCTGGIRCEKASAYLKSMGFPEVYHLKGGILNYLEKIPAKDSLWQGECVVFDERGGVSHKD